MRTDQGPPGSLALFSDDNRYRFLLMRSLALQGDDRLFFACGLNPSTADAFKDDPTIRRELGFAAAFGCRIFVKANAYAWRDTKPENMWAAARDGIDVIGDRNDQVILESLHRLKTTGRIALACWGKHAKRDRVMQLVNLARDAGVQWQCLGVNKDGSPKHPLYLPKTTTLQPWG